MPRRGDGIYKRGKTWWLDIFINHARYQKRLGRGITRTVALELAAIERAKILRGEAGIGRKSKKDLTFDEARKKFEDWIKGEKRPNTIRTYTACLDYLSEEFSGKRLSQITAWSLEAYKKRRGEGRELTERPSDISDKEWERRRIVAKRGAPVRCNRELATVKVLFNKCIAWGLYQGENPMKKVRYRREPRNQDRFLDPTEETRLLSAAQEPLRSLILIAIHTGLRVKAEALTLKWECVDLKRGFLTVESGYAKNGHTRNVPLNSIAFNTLKAMKETATSEYVFAKKDGTPYSDIGTSFRHAWKRAKIPKIRPHDLRHTFGSRLVMAGVDLRTVQELGGWADLTMVMRYAHLAPQHKTKAIERLVHFTDPAVSNDNPDHSLNVLHSIEAVPAS